VKPVPSLDRHDARDDWNCDSGSPDSFRPTNEYFDVVEHLSEYPAASDINFFFEILHLALRFFRRKQDSLREPWDRNVEVVAVLSSDVFNKINAMNKATVNSFPSILSFGWIASKSENVPATVLFRRLEPFSSIEV
jgi:hypothetical protein